ncbi:hypothetical protein B0H19DRAFT_1233363 [Mycena capillaripes]|nr:hypothetical protein B0H19DRAFT_1233363 [Mycena capillaripes]
MMSANPNRCSGTSMYLADAILLPSMITDELEGQNQRRISVWRDTIGMTFDLYTVMMIKTQEAILLKDVGRQQTNWRKQLLDKWSEMSWLKSVSLGLFPKNPNSDTLNGPVSQSKIFTNCRRSQALSLATEVREYETNELSVVNTSNPFLGTAEDGNAAKHGSWLELSRSDEEIHEYLLGESGKEDERGTKRGSLGNTSGQRTSNPPIQEHACLRTSQRVETRGCGRIELGGQRRVKRRWSRGYGYEIKLRAAAGHLITTGMNDHERDGGGNVKERCMVTVHRGGMVVEDKELGMHPRAENENPSLAEITKPRAKRHKTPCILPTRNSEAASDPAPKCIVTRKIFRSSSVQPLQLSTSIVVSEFDHQAEFVKSCMPLLHNAQKRHAAWHKLSRLHIVLSTATAVNSWHHNGYGPSQTQPSFWIFEPSPVRDGNKDGRHPRNNGTAEPAPCQAGKSCILSSIFYVPYLTPLRFGRDFHDILSDATTSCRDGTGPSPFTGGRHTRKYGDGVQPYKIIRSFTQCSETTIAPESGQGDWVK